VTGEGAGFPVTKDTHAPLSGASPWPVTVPAIEPVESGDEDEAAAPAPRGAAIAKPTVARTRTVRRTRNGSPKEEGRPAKYFATTAWRATNLSRKRVNRLRDFPYLSGKPARIGHALGAMKVRSATVTRPVVKAASVASARRHHH